MFFQPITMPYAITYDVQTSMNEPHRWPNQQNNKWTDYIMAKQQQQRCDCLPQREEMSKSWTRHLTLMIVS